MFFKKVIISFFLIFSLLMLFIFFIRLANNKSGFLGFSDLISYFETSKVDFYYPLKNFSDDIGGMIKDFQSWLSSLQVNNPWDAIVVVVTGVANIFKLTFIPVVFIFDVFRLIVSYIAIFGNFISFIISFDGYPAIVY